MYGCVLMRTHTHGKTQDLTGSDLQLFTAHAAFPARRDFPWALR